MIASARLTFAGVILVVCLASLDHNIVATALPSVVSDLGGMEHLSWVVAAFLLPATVTMPLYGKFSDLFGRRNTLAAAITIFIVGSALCGAAQSMLQLILFRGLQGLGAGGLFTLALTVIADIIEPAQRPRYQSLIVTAVAASQFAGPLAGGLLTEFFSWRWIFFINPPLGLLALAIVWRGLPVSTRAKAPTLDYLGVITLIVATTCFMLALTWGGSEHAWTSPLIVSLIVGSGLFAALFIWAEARAAEPILPLHIFTRRAYTLGVIALTLMTFAMHGTMVFAPLYLQTALGLSPAQSGATVIAQVAGMLIVSAWITRSAAVSERLKTVILCGVALEALAITGFAANAFGLGGYAVFAAFLFLRGVGMGAGVPMITTLVQNAADPKHLGAATSSMMFIRSLGGVIGVSVAGVIINVLAHNAPLDPDAQRHAIGAVFTLNAVVMFLAVALITVIPAVSPTPLPPSPRSGEA